MCVRERRRGRVEWPLTSWIFWASVLTTVCVVSLPVYHSNTLFQPFKYLLCSSPYVSTNLTTLPYYHTIKLISHASKVMFKILQARFQHYVNQELPNEQVGFTKGRGTRDQIANIHWIMEKAKEFQKNIYFCFIDCTKAFDCVDHNTLCLVRSGTQTCPLPSGCASRCLGDQRTGNSSPPQPSSCLMQKTPRAPPTKLCA